MAQGMLCDMFGARPHKPRYVLPDYARFLRQGSAWLELAPPPDFRRGPSMPCASSTTTFLPSPACRSGWDGSIICCCPSSVSWMMNPPSQAEGFWIYLDPVLPDAFMHVNIGPDDNRICRLILRIDNELPAGGAESHLLPRPGVQTPDACCCRRSKTSPSAAPHLSTNYRSTATPSTGAVWHRRLLQPSAAGRGPTPWCYSPSGGVAEQAGGRDFMAHMLPHLPQAGLPAHRGARRLPAPGSGFFDSFLVEGG